MRDFIDAIQEHTDKDGNIPTDHSLKPYGAVFFPSSSKDLLIETIQG